MSMPAQVALHALDIQTQDVLSTQDQAQLDREPSGRAQSALNKQRIPNIDWNGRRPPLLLFAFAQ
jgi:hypothetical protein